MLLIGGIQKTSLIDFPKKVAAVVFTQGCNFRCGYCHNSELLELNKFANYKSSDFFDFLEKRRGKLDGVVITGGEPTLQSELYDFVSQIKEMGFDIKLDTNGTNPKVLNRLVDDNLLDYIAMDIKAPLEKYSQITGTSVNFENISKSIDFIMKCGIDYEFRTTVVKSQLSFEDFEKIGQMINGAKRYYLQKFVPTKVYDEKFMAEISYTDLEFSRLCSLMERYVKSVNWR